MNIQYYIIMNTTLWAPQRLLYDIHTHSLSLPLSLSLLSLGLGLILLIDSKFKFCIHILIINILWNLTLCQFPEWVRNEFELNGCRRSWLSACVWMAAITIDRSTQLEQEKKIHTFSNNNRIHSNVWWWWRQQWPRDNICYI